MSLVGLLARVSGLLWGPSIFLIPRLQVIGATQLSEPFQGLVFRVWGLGFRVCIFLRV